MSFVRLMVPDTVEECSRIVYLDQLHWIEISKSIHGRGVRKGTAEVLAHMRKRASDGELLFPLSLAHYLETLKQADPGRRKRLSAVMRELSGGHTLADHSTVVRHEIRSALISKLNLGAPVAPLKLLGCGMEHALGRKLNFRLEWPHPEKVPEDVRNRIEGDVFDLLESTFLSGVLDVGKAPVLFPQMNLGLDKKFEDHLAEWRGCAAKMSTAELRRKVYATTLVDIQAPLSGELVDLGVSMEQFAKLGEPVWCELLDMMPSRRADMHLRTQWAKNANLNPKISDLNDWTYVAIAVCYCDLVVTENQMNNLLQRSDEFAPKCTAGLTDVLKL